jgi:hypothetical protein
MSVFVASNSECNPLINGFPEPPTWFHATSPTGWGFPVLDGAVIYWGGHQAGHQVVCYVITNTEFRGDDFGCPVDTDGDGLTDEIDPYPDDGSDFTFKIIAEQHDEADNRLYFCIETNRNDIFCYGEQDPEIETYINIGGGLATYGGSQLADLLGYVETQEITGDSAELGTITITESVPQDEIGMDTGLDQGGGSDSVLLGKIVDNTNQITENQIDLGTYQNDIRNENAKTNELLEKIIAQNNFNPEIKVEIPEVEPPEDYTGTGTSPGDWATGWAENMDNSMDGAGMPDGDLDSNNYTEESWFTSFLNNNPYKTALDNSGVEVSSPVCTKTLTVLGSVHEMDLCFLEEPLTLAGNLLFAIITLLSVLTIVRGR